LFTNHFDFKIQVKNLLADVSLQYVSSVCCSYHDTCACLGNLTQKKCNFGNQGVSSHSEETKKTARASPLGAIGDVTEAETHQDVEIMEMRQRE